MGDHFCSKVVSSVQGRLDDGAKFSGLAENEAAAQERVKDQGCSTGSMTLGAPSSDPTPSSGQIAAIYTTTRIRNFLEHCDQRAYTEAFVGCRVVLDHLFGSKARHGSYVHYHHVDRVPDVRDDYLLRREFCESWNNHLPVFGVRVPELRDGTSIAACRQFQIRPVAVEDGTDIRLRVAEDTILRAGDRLWFGLGGRPPSAGSTLPLPSGLGKDAIDGLRRFLDCFDLTTVELGWMPVVQLRVQDWWAEQTLDDLHFTNQSGVNILAVCGPEADGDAEELFYPACDTLLKKEGRIFASSLDIKQIIVNIKQHHLL